MGQQRLSTANKYVSIPDIPSSTAGIGNIGFMHNGFRACIEMHGAEDSPLLVPFVELDREDQGPTATQGELVSYWIPRFTMSSPKTRAMATVFAPLERRGFVCVLIIENTSDADVHLRAGWRGCWKKCYHTAKLRKQMAGVKYASISSWQAGVPVLEYRSHTPLYAMALVSGEIMQTRLWNGDPSVRVEEWSGEGVSASVGEPVYYELADDYELKPLEKKTIAVYVGLGLEEVSAVASGRDLRLHGWEQLYSGLTDWLDSRTIDCDDAHLKCLMNVNSFYNYFYAQSTTLDTEMLVVAAARSSRSDVCAAYRDTDAMLWTMPAVLQISQEQARRILTYAFTTQLPNVGLRSRFIDGIVLEPGLQLDHLCAPIRALRLYVQLTGDMSVLFDRRVQTGVNTIQQVLAAQRHPDRALFETLLLPSGEPSRYPYVCYSNVLVWRVLLDAAWLYDRIRDVDRAEEANALATQVREAVWDNFIVEGPYGKAFALSIDLEGNYELGDDSAGSLQLLSYYGFCSPDDAPYRNTVEWIHSEHNPLWARRKSGTGPAETEQASSSVLSLVNDLLTGRKEEALEFLKRAHFDNGIACEWVSPESGTAAGGRAFASCAGYLALALRIALGASPPETAIMSQRRRPGETLYELPPEPSHDSRKARL